ncbi:DmpA family aminopeptidase [Neobacillus kokaensis]|uniref:Aminopeptidase n=1 Tax=Neobacillus kokaensis TaxID=2759023 RepID=A0ABQ3N6Y8_9BACI|nr:P1 family peptidase [Neobacillus kokaensis]GHI00695.1 aminopeptidase [Neobacillus kokaensis]
MKIRELGLTIGKLPAGKKNCITDVEGVRVGHVTLDYPLDEEGNEYACTGVTAILPHGGNLFKEKVTAASYVINGFGKTTGLVQVNELGVLESPIMLTNTFGVPAAAQGTLEYMLDENPEIGDTTGTINVVIGECNDSYLNSIRLFPVKPEHAIEAIKKATTNRAEEGAVGAGKGMVCFGHKGGIGSSSRIVEGYTVGCMVLSNFGRREEFRSFQYTSGNGISETSDGSIIIVLATDAPLSDRQLLRVAKRCGIGLGRTGSHYSHGSGDIVIALSTAHKIAHFADGVTTETRTQVREDHSLMNGLFAAAAEATEEAILNSLSQAASTKGRAGRVVEHLDFMKESN